MMRRVREFVEREILYMMPDVVKKTYSGAMMGDIKAQRAMLEMAGMLKAGAGVTLNNTVVQPTMYEEMSDQSFIEQFERAVRERRIGPEENE